MLAYFDCYSGVSGDMILGALIDAGLEREKLESQLGQLSLSSFVLKVEQQRIQGLVGTRVEVVPTEKTRTQTHRTLTDILKLLEESSLTSGVREKASVVFRNLAEAEGKIHGIRPEEVEFHEVGSLDAIVEVVGAVVGLEVLGVDKVYSSALPLGSGFVETSHGTLPVPAPAVLELLRKAGAPAIPSPANTELVTPTGAAILITVARFEQPSIIIDKIGYGFGSKKLPWPNALRLLLGRRVDSKQPKDTVALIEANIDDMSGELLGHTQETLFAAGALDVFFTPIQMKKNRPGVMLSIIAPVELVGELSSIVLTESTTLGVRYQVLERLKCERWHETVETPLGPVRMKVARFGDNIKAAPEYEDCVRLAREKGISLREVYQLAAHQAQVRGWRTYFPQ